LKKIKVNSKKIQNDIYKNIFLDKKRIDKYPRYINIKNIGEPSIKEIKDFDLLNDVIIEIIK
jgi:3-dehydroquinate synthetase